MFGKLSAITGAGIILPEPIKTYFFMPQRRVQIRVIRAYDVFDRIDLMYVGNHGMSLEIPRGLEHAYIIETTEKMLDSEVDSLARSFGHSNLGPGDLMRSCPLRANEIRSIEFLVSPRSDHWSDKRPG